MCGIVLAYTAGKSRASKKAFKRYEAQKLRGKEGYGCVTVSHRKVNKLYRSEDENGIRKILGDKSDMALFHHRNPTSTPNFEECTHPIFVSNEKLEYDYYVVHNGVIDNCNLLKVDFEKLGFVYTTEIQEMYKIGGKVRESNCWKFNDSESFAIDLCIAIEEGKSALQSRGAIAFVALQVDKETKSVDTIFFGRNNRNPLVIENNDDGLTIASQGSGIEVEAHRLHAYDTKTKKVTSTYFDVGLSYVPPSNSSNYSGNRETANVVELLPSKTPSPYFNTAEERKGNIGFIQHKDDSHHATHDIMRNQASKFIEKSNKRLKKKKNFKLEKGFLTIKNHANTDTTIDFLLQDNKLYKTDIDLCDLELLTFSEWSWYQRVIKDQNTYRGIMGYNKKMKAEYNKTFYIDQLKSLAMQLGNISNLINSRGYNKAHDEVVEELNKRWVDIDN